MNDQQVVETIEAEMEKWNPKRQVSQFDVALIIACEIIRNRFQGGEVQISKDLLTSLVVRLIKCRDISVSRGAEILGMDLPAFRANALDFAINAIDEQGKWMEWPRCPICEMALQHHAADGWICRNIHCEKDTVNVETRYRVVK